MSASGSITCEQTRIRRLPEGLHTLDVTDGIALFTDGSSWSKDRSGGWAWIAIDAYEGEAHDSGHAQGTTNNRMEMMAWIEGLVSLAEVHGPCHVLVYSDSQYVGYGVTRPNRQRRANVEYWNILDLAVGLHWSVEFVHVKGHSGDHLNERVDKMAGQARKEGRDEAQ